tara:strand:+ start:1314 stop:1466 length:153 start_codon:yes stop_codon:yes gene_type:complete
LFLSGFKSLKIEGFLLLLINLVRKIQNFNVVNKNLFQEFEEKKLLAGVIF